MKSETRFVTANGITHHTVWSNPGEPEPWVLINSLGTDLRIWERLLPRLNPDLSILRYDKRGHGLSDCPAGPYRMDDLVADLRGVLDCLKVSAAALIGISIGGMIALDFTARHPERVSALVLCDTAARIGNAQLWNDRIRELRRRGLEALSQSIVQRWFTSRFAVAHPGWWRGCLNMLSRMPAAGYAATCEAIRDADLTARLSSVRAPTLVLCGAEDRATPVAQVRELAHGVNGAQFKTIADAAHLPCIEQPDATASILAQFIQRGRYV